MKKETIGILWGMWPEATAYLYKNILDYCQKKYGAVQDIDYPHMLINNIWLQGFDETWVTDEELVKQWLLSGIQQLDNAWVNKIYMACNTVHEYYDYLISNSKGNIVNLIEQTSQKIKEQWHKKVLILSSKTTNELWLYDKYLQEKNIDFFKINNNEQEKIDEIIENVMWWNTSENDFQYIENISKQYEKLWATWVIIWCTELPLATKPENIDIEVFDTLWVLTEMISESVKK